MRFFVTGATVALGRHLVPGLVAAGHLVTATTRSAAKTGQLREAGAEPVVVNGLDRAAVIVAVRAAAPEVIVHQMTALADMRSLRRFDRVFAATNELRTRGTDNLLAAAAEAGTRRVVAQSYTGWPNERSGGPVKTESDPLDPRLSRRRGSRWRRSGTWNRPFPPACPRALRCAAAASTVPERPSPCWTWCASGRYR